MAGSRLRSGSGFLGLVLGFLGLVLGFPGLVLGYGARGTLFVFSNFLGSFAQIACGTEFQEAIDGAREVALAAGLVHIEGSREGSRVAELRGMVFGGIGKVAGLFEPPEAHLLPAGDNHVVDEGAFNEIGGSNGLGYGMVELIEALARLARKHDGPGKHAMPETIGGGLSLAARGGGAVGFFAVNARLIVLILGSHSNGSIEVGRTGGELSGLDAA